MYWNSSWKFQRETKGLRGETFDNVKDMLFVVTDIEDPMKIFEWNNIPKDLDEE